MKSIVVRTFGRALTPFILIYGVYLTIFGPSSPGGGFQGGAVLASAVILVIVTHGRERIKRLSRHIEWFNSFGVFIFLLVGSLGIFFGKSFLINLTPNTTITLVFLDIIIAMKVFAGIVVLVIFFFEQGMVES